MAIAKSELVKKREDKDKRKADAKKKRRPSKVKQLKAGDK
jgi:hypothetical protein